MQKTEEFTVSIPTSDGDTLRGKFKIKLRLSHRDRLQMDEIRRNLLGTKSSEASQEAYGLASALAKIQVHLLDAPSWWKENSNGLDFEDDEVVLAVLEGLTKVENEYRAKIQKEADEARGDLKKELEEAKGVK